MKARGTVGLGWLGTVDQTASASTCEGSQLPKGADALGALANVLKKHLGGLRSASKGHGVPSHDGRGRAGVGATSRTAAFRTMRYIRGSAGATARARPKVPRRRRRRRAARACRPRGPTPAAARGSNPVVRLGWSRPARPTTASSLCTAPAALGAGTAGEVRRPRGGLGVRAGVEPARPVPVDVLDADAVTA